MAFLGVANVIGGVEVQVRRTLYEKPPFEDFSLGEYVDAFRSTNGDGMANDALAYVTYPGAKAGRLYVNHFFD